MLVKEIKKCQLTDLTIQKYKQCMELGLAKDFMMHDDGLLRFHQSQLVIASNDIRRKLLDESHRSVYAIHPGGTKMYRDMKQHYWWKGMKRDIEDYVSKCLVCQQVKIEHQRSAGLLKPLPIPAWKWQDVTMDFVTKLPMTQKKNDVVWVIMD